MGNFWSKPAAPTVPSVPPPPTVIGPFTDWVDAKDRRLSLQKPASGLGQEQVRKTTLREKVNNRGPSLSFATSPQPQSSPGNLPARSGPSFMSQLQQQRKKETAKYVSDRINPDWPGFDSSPTLAQDTLNLRSLWDDQQSGEGKLLKTPGSRPWGLPGQAAEFKSPPTSFFSPTLAQDTLTAAASSTTNSKKRGRDELSKGN